MKGIVIFIIAFVCAKTYAFTDNEMLEMLCSLDDVLIGRWFDCLLENAPKSVSRFANDIYKCVRGKPRVISGTGEVMFGLLCFDMIKKDVMNCAIEQKIAFPFLIITPEDLDALILKMGPCFIKAR